ncbi:MAG: glycosyltransferase family 2 protein, partial [Candidatus Omnitrophota bacterium]
MKKIAPLVSIVVVNYNGRQYLKKCFRALSKLNYPGNKIEILMVDNCSDDDSVNLVKKNFPKVKILKNDINNYARANNLGAKKAKGDFIAFINNDVQVHKNWLVELINVMHREKRLGIAGGKILFIDGRIHSTGHEEYPNFCWGDRGFRHEDKGQYENVEEVPSLCGAAVLFRKSCLDQIGLFDEDFIMYLEDVDMCFRCTRDNWKVLYVPKSIAKHHFRGTSSAESARYFSERNRLLLIAKHFPMQLGEALYGKGYFTGGENNIYDIFPLIFAKLLKSQRIDAIKANLPVIFKNFKNISVLEKSMLMDKIDEFNNSITQNKALIAELSRTNAQLHEQAQRVTKDIELKDALLREKEASQAELSRTNAQLHEQAQRV